MILNLWNASDCGRDSPPDILDAEESLRGFEKKAWSSYLKIARTLDTSGLSKSADEFPATHVVSVLVKIGLDEAFVKMLFGLASEAWRTLSVASEKVIPLRPDIQRDIDDVRQGLLVEADRKITISPGATLLTPQESYDHLRIYMDPANLHLLFDEITTSWIILPRAYAFLKCDHVNYLSAYLEMIDNETNEQVLHIFTRIAIEFLANFTIRFADERYPREQVVELVVAGYTALFWRNLNAPPRGFEDIRIFEHYLTWLKYTSCRKKISNQCLDATIQDMEERMAEIFPSGSGLMRKTNERRDISGFIIALRHGCIGIDCTVRYFWLTPVNIQWPRGWNIRWSIIVFSLKALFDVITCRYEEESKRTQYYIREFLFQLNNSYVYSDFHSTTLDKQNRTDMQCLRSKITTMIQRLQHTLTTIPS